MNSLFDNFEFVEQCIKKEMFLEKMEQEKFDIKKINLFKRYVSNLIYIKEISTNILKIKETKKILVFNFEITNNKINEIVKIIYQLFNKTQPIILEIKFNDNFYYSLNNGCLMNENINTIFKKNYYVSELLNINELPSEFTFDNLNKNSILDLFFDICYKFIFFYVLKIDKPFKPNISYKALIAYSQNKNHLKKIKSLNKKITQTHNFQNVENINKQIIDLKKQIESNYDFFEKEYNMFKK